MALHPQPGPGISADWVYCLPARHGTAPRWERHTYSRDGARFDCVAITGYAGPSPDARDIQGWIAAATGYTWSAWAGPTGGRLDVTDEGQVYRPGMPGLLAATSAVDRAGAPVSRWQFQASTGSDRPSSWYRTDPLPDGTTLELSVLGHIGAPSDGAPLFGARDLVTRMAMSWAWEVYHQTGRDAWTRISSDCVWAAGAEGLTAAMALAEDVARFYRRWDADQQPTLTRAPRRRGGWLVRLIGGGR